VSALATGAQSGQSVRMSENEAARRAPRAFHDTGSITVQAPVETVARFMTDQSNAEQCWGLSATTFEWKTSAPLHVGSTFEITVRLPQFTGSRSWRVEELVQTERLMLRSAYPTLSEITYHWSSEDSGGTALSLRKYYLPSGPALVMGTLLKPVARWDTRHHLRRLKRILESLDPKTAT